MPENITQELKDKAYLIGIQSSTQSEKTTKELLAELEELCMTLKIPTVGYKIIRIDKPQARYLCGEGKVFEVIEECQNLEATLIIFDDALSPSQQRNWERATGAIPVIDRREVILDIFADRATTKEAALQIQLAKTEYELPRLTRAWSHLSRQRGAANMKGEGERQIELDRRIVRTRIQMLQAELVKVRQQRATQRKQRQKKPVPNAAIVGYTNAGKSSLLNLLTGAEVLADDKLFATLDPTTRRIHLTNKQELLLTDTVGFIRKLPHDLVDAFKATLEEAVLADFLIHVVDASSIDALEHIKTTNQVLTELGADMKRTVTLFNKVDLVDSKATLASLRSLVPDALFISTKTSDGIEKLKTVLEQILVEDLSSTQLIIPFDRYDIIALLHRTSLILSEEYDGNTVNIEAAIPINIHGKIKSFIRT